MEFMYPRLNQSLSTDQTCIIIDSRLTNVIHLTLKMSSAQVVETSVSNNSSFQNYTHPDDYKLLILLGSNYLLRMITAAKRFRLDVFPSLSDA